jgi:putative membrane protein
MNSLKSIPKNDRLAHIIIISLSVVVFALVTLMRKVKLDIDFGFDTHIFPAISATLNSIVAILLLVGLYFILNKDWLNHKRSMMLAMLFSILFLVTYVLYHFTTVETVYGGEGFIKTVYYVLLFSHITLAGVILPFILYAVYRGLTGEYHRHKKLTKWVWPIWFYVSVTGVVVYFMISPYYV